MTSMDARTSPSEAAVMSLTDASRIPQADPEGRVRVLVVGAALTRELEAMLPLQSAWQLEPVNSFLAAMGELTHRSVEVVVGPLEAMSGMEAPTATALRQLAPTTFLLALAQDVMGAEARTLCDAGFDGVLPWNDRQKEASFRQLFRWLEARSHPEAEADAGGAAELKSPGPGPHPRSSLLLGKSAGQPQAAEGEAADSRVSPAMRVQSRPDEGLVEAPPDALSGVILGASPEVADAPPEAAPLGDIDLVDALLIEEGKLFAVAGRLIEQRTGFKQLKWLPGDRVVPREHVAVPVTSRDGMLGLLAAPMPVTARELEPWAQWLGHWLRLERRLEQLRDLSLRDELTGAWNRRYFFRSLEKALAEATEKRQQVTVLLFDIDDFKNYNDTFGHATGDEILREVARLMQGMVREGDVVARIGGDEFAVIFCDRPEPRRQGSRHPADVIQTARRFQEAVCEHRFPRLLSVQGTLTISGGLAGFPWDGRTAEELVERADQMALESKRQGKNVITLGDGRLHHSD